MSDKRLSHELLVLEQQREGKYFPTVATFPFLKEVGQTTSDVYQVLTMLSVQAGGEKIIHIYFDNGGDDEPRANAVFTMVEKPSPAGNFIFLQTPDQSTIMEEDEQRSELGVSAGIPLEQFYMHLAALAEKYETQLIALRIIADQAVEDEVGQPLAA